jgi:A/G-specific adenine glycosylase
MFRELIQWSQTNYSHLPWRKKRSPYHTLVSEIMLQQTTVSTVLGKFDFFIERFPDIQALARATEEEVTIAWKGLGYYRRARNLRKAAIYIGDHFDGVIPEDYQGLISIPGIGHYTAKALLAIGQDKAEIALDANLERVISRIYGIEMLKGPQLIRRIDELFDGGKILRQIHDCGGRALNEALMDLGRVYCQKSKATCLLCPVRQNCKAYQHGMIGTCPSYPQSKQEKHDLKLLRVVVRKGDKVLAYQKPKDLWLAGQWELPTFTLSSSDQKLKQYPAINKSCGKQMVAFKSTITKYKIENTVVEMTESEFLKRFKTLDGLSYHPMCGETVNFSSTALKVFKNMEQ